MIEVLKQALEALENMEKIRNCQRTNGYPLSDADKKIQKAITSLRQAIKELESQEPVAWFTQARNFVPLDECTKEEAKLYGWNELYLRPPQRKPLTPDAVFRIADQHPVEGFDPDIMAFARAIEAAHGIKE